MITRKEREFTSISLLICLAHFDVACVFSVKHEVQSSGRSGWTAGSWSVKEGHIDPARTAGLVSCKHPVHECLLTERQVTRQSLVYSKYCGVFWDARPGFLLVWAYWVDRIKDQHLSSKAYMRYSLLFFSCCKPSWAFTVAERTLLREGQ